MRKHTKMKPRKIRFIQTEAYQKIVSGQYPIKSQSRPLAFSKA